MRAFERLYRSQVDRIHSLARRMVGPEEADDLTQEVFVKAWSRLDTYRGGAAFGTWLYRLGLNLMADHRRARNRRPTWLVQDVELEMDEIAPGGTFDVASIDFESALEALPTGARQVFVLHDVEGFRHEEIAETLGIAAGTSKSQLHRARMLLRERLSR